MPPGVADTGPERRTAADRLDAAPHVRTAVAVACGGEADAVRQALATLDVEQRRGWRVLPEPLPPIAALETRARGSLPPDAAPDQVLALALCGSGPLAALCGIAGVTAERITASPLSLLVRMHGGRFRVADPALRTQVLAASTPPERLRAHQLLAEAFAAAGDEDAALWHRARGSVSGQPALVDPLLAQARSALRGGAAHRAWTRAVEAAEHAPPDTETRARALLCAGHAALSGGWAVDALERIEQALRIEGAHREEATTAFLSAHTLRHGAITTTAARVPDQDAAAIGDGDRRVAQALRAGLDGDPDAGVRALSEPDLRDPPEPVTRLPEHGPVPRARTAVATVLLHVWAGRIGVAQELLRDAASELPIALPFGGLAVALSRRLDLWVDGTIGGCSRDLAASVPWTQAPDGYVDRAIDAYLQGRSDEAAVHMGLWADLGRPAEAFGVPGLDEVGPLTVPAAPEPPEATAARALRVRVRALRESSWRADLDAVAGESRAIRSPFERARVEALLGSACAARGDRGRSVRHLRAARSLFDEAGARAWRGMVERRLRMTAGRGPRSGRDDAHDDGPCATLEVCRANWEPILTARELEVALLMADGRTNREIAAALHVSVRTVEVHGGRIFAKLDVRTRHELAVLAHRTDQHL